MLVFLHCLYLNLVPKVTAKLLNIRLCIIIDHKGSTLHNATFAVQQIENDRLVFCPDIFIQRPVLSTRHADKNRFHDFTFSQEQDITISVLFYSRLKQRQQKTLLVLSTQLWPLLEELSVEVILLKHKWKQLHDGNKPS